VEVLVNDRGPYIRKRGRYSRDLDLSEAAAERLGLIAAGVDKVSYKSIEYPPAKETSADQLLPLTPRPSLE
jgi:rare lipoprotein A (peptidoglycan hydrolase)